jgi:hypothetical protein
LLKIASYINGNADGYIIHNRNIYPMISFITSLWPEKKKGIGFEEREEGKEE